MGSTECFFFHRKISKNIVWSFNEKILGQNGCPTKPFSHQNVHISPFKVIPQPCSGCKFSYFRSALGLSITECHIETHGRAEVWKFTPRAGLKYEDFDPGAGLRCENSDPGRAEVRKFIPRALLRYENLPQWQGWSTSMQSFVLVILTKHFWERKISWKSLLIFI